MSDDDPTPRTESLPVYRPCTTPQLRCAPAPYAARHCVLRSRSSPTAPHNTSVTAATLEPATVPQKVLASTRRAAPCHAAHATRVSSQPIAVTCPAPAPLCVRGFLREPSHDPLPSLTRLRARHAEARQDWQDTGRQEQKQSSRAPARLRLRLLGRGGGTREDFKPEPP